ncbi:hypothetical protein DHEL01_v213056 [Diaporthe helianthi]|uniref:Uncharacterized protein n=1 Tax=Diaporthe helianthi TaxID=158607 RepID=A0A2P5HE89_DIAHE|nr:hypothetical protein DHEL01_v213056 [Diaporthe helianthi]
MFLEYGMTFAGMSSIMSSMAMYKEYVYNVERVGRDSPGSSRPTSSWTEYFETARSSPTPPAAFGNQWHLNGEKSAPSSSPTKTVHQAQIPASTGGPAPKQLQI